MGTHRARQDRAFTIEEANAMLPLVGAIASDLMSLSHEVVERRLRLSLLMPAHTPNPDCPYQQELAQISEELEKDGRRLQNYVQELHELGVEPRSVTDGVVDFPSTIEGRSGYLCWRPGESEVQFWHPADSGCGSRQLLAEPVEK